MDGLKAATKAQSALGYREISAAISNDDIWSKNLQGCISHFVIIIFVPADELKVQDICRNNYDQMLVPYIVHRHLRGYERCLEIPNFSWYVYLS